MGTESSASLYQMILLSSRRFPSVPMAHWFEEGMSTKRFYQKDEERNLLSFNEEIGRAHV